MKNQDRFHIVCREVYGSDFSEGSKIFQKFFVRWFDESGINDIPEKKFNQLKGTFRDDFLGFLDK